MKSVKELTCIGCPMGCTVSAEIEDGVIGTVTGNTCPRGKEYAQKELTHPERTVTSTVAVDGGILRMLPVRTARDIPKDKVFEVMEQLHTFHVKAPMKTGEIIICNAAGTGVNIIATRDVGASAAV